MSFDVLPVVIRAQREAVRAATERTAALEEAEEKLRRAEETTGMQLRSQQRARVGSAPCSTLFGAAFAARSADRKARALVDSGVAKLSRELEERRSIEAQCRLEIEKAAEELAQTFEAARAHKQRVTEAVAKERAALDDKGDTFYQGCAFGLGLGCLALACYIVLTVAMIFTGRQAGASSPLAVVFLTLFVVPIGVSAFLQILYGLKRMMVESELSARVRTADDVCERAIERAKKSHAGTQPGLKQLLEEAGSAAEKIEAALQGLAGETAG